MASDPVRRTTWLWNGISAKVSTTASALTSDADDLLLHRLRMQEAVDHRQQQPARRGRDEAGLRHARQRLGLAVAEAMLLVGRRQRVADRRRR